jgi:hypothetical protein
MYKIIIPVLLLVGLAACAPAISRDETSYFYSVPVGSTIELKQTVTILPEQVAVLMQYGQYRTESNLDKYYPHCKFEIYSIAETRRTVQPDRFTIIRVVDSMEETTQLPMQPLASLNFSAGGPSVYNYITEMYLRSDRQPGVYRMTCMHWESIIDDRYLTVQQMREAMGELFTLELVQ